MAEVVKAEIRKGQDGFWQYVVVGRDATSETTFTGVRWTHRGVRGRVKRLKQWIAEQEKLYRDWEPV